MFIFNCLTLNVNLFIFNLFDVKFLFSENHIFRKQKRTAVYGRASLNSPGKMMICYLRDINKFLRYRTLCKSILKCGFNFSVLNKLLRHLLRYLFSKQGISPPLMVFSRTDFCDCYEVTKSRNTIGLELQMIQYTFRIEILSKDTPSLQKRDWLKNGRDNEVEIECSMSKTKYDECE